jgi:hypothetical protein
LWAGDAGGGANRWQPLINTKLSGSSGSTNDNPVDLTGGFHFVEPRHVVVVRPSARRYTAPPVVLPPPVAALPLPPRPTVVVLPPVLPPAPPLAAPLVGWVNKPAPNTLRETVYYSRETLTNSNFRANRYKRVLVTRDVGNREDLALQTGLSRDMVKCPQMEDEELREYVDKFVEGLEHGVIPYHAEAHDGRDPITGVKRDSRPDPAKVRSRNYHFEAWVRKTFGVDLEELPPTDVALPPEWYGSQLFMYLCLYTKRFVGGSRAGAKEDGSRFNIWHCWLYEMFVKFHPLLLRFQEPTLEHFLVSNQQYKTEGRHTCTSTGGKQSGSQTPSSAKQPRSVKRSKSR